MANKGPTAAKFRDAFLQSFHEICDRMTPAQWNRRAWPCWTKFMLAHPSSVLTQTAEKLKLHYYDGEPLRLDAVFSTEEESWFPILVALEHEAKPREFVKDEVKKLLSVRSNLKVGITYVWDDAQAGSNRKRIEQGTREQFDKMGSSPAEAPRTEYLFLVGTESGNKILCWHSLQFRASEGPKNKVFQLVKAD